jgi:hypothetical protein
MFEAGEDRIHLAAGADREPGGDQRVLDLEFADQRQPDQVPAAAMFEVELLRKTIDGGLDQANALACAVGIAADGDDPQAAFARGMNDFPRTIMIG